MKIIPPIWSSLKYILSSAEREARRSGIPAYIDKEIRLVKGFEKLVNAKPAPNQWFLFNELTTKKTHKNEEVVAAFTKLALSKPTEKEWAFFEEIFSRYQEKNWILIHLARYCANVFEQKPTDDELLFLKQLVDHQEKINRPADYLIYAFSDLLQTRRDSEQWLSFKNKASSNMRANTDVEVLTHVFANVIPHNPPKEKLELVFSAHDFYSEQGWIYDAKAVKGLCRVLAEVIKTELSPDQIKIYKELLSHQRTQKQEIENLSYHYLNFIKSNIGDMKDAKWDLFKKSAKHYTNNDFKLNYLTHQFCHIASLDFPPENWTVFQNSFDEYLNNNLLLDKLFDSFINLKDSNPEKLKKCFDITLSYTKEHLGTKGLTDFLKAKPEEEHWQAFKTIIETKPVKKKDDILPPPIVDGDITEATFLDDEIVDSIDDDSEFDLTLEELDFNEIEKSATNDTNLTTKELAINELTKLISAKPTKEQWDIYKELLDKYKDSTEISAITSGVRELVEKNAPVTLLSLYKTAVDFHLSKNSYLLAFIKSYCEILTEAGENTSQAMLNTYINAVSKGHLKNANDSVKFLRELTVNACITTWIRSNTPEKIKWASTKLETLIKTDPLPYALNTTGHDSSKVLKMLKETQDVYARAYDFYHGFSALTYETKRVPGGEPSLLLRFGHDVANSVKYVNAKNPNLFPGRGFAISFIKPETVFAADKSIKEGEDPYHEYKKAWSWLANEFDDLHKTHFIFMRGMAIVTNVDKDKYSLKDIDNKKIHYSYVILNDHHHNYSAGSAFLIPTQVLSDKLKNVAIKYEDYSGPSAKHNDVNEVGLNIEDLIEDAKKIPANVLNLTWGSNISSGLCNAYPPNSKPFHEWEVEMRARHETEDNYGHIHKSHRFGTYRANMDPELEKAMIPLREAHNQVFNVTNKYQNLLDLFRLTLALWHKGQTLGDPVEMPDMTDDDLFNKADKPESIKELFRDESASFTNPDSLRMLVEAYRWHKGKESGKTNRNDFPILVIADTLDYWNKPNSSFTLDTYDLTLKFGDKTIPLDPENIGDIEKKLWEKIVMPQVVNPDKDFRFYDRRDLGIK